jgi:ABC-type transport system involved in cytochrome bd biosynthesis fused ATPase/permease subunit
LIFVGTEEETYARAQKTFASIRRVRGLLALEPTIKNCRAAIKFPQDRLSTIEMADVRFAYPGSDGVLCIPHLGIKAGEHVAIVGENGAGKSTLATNSLYREAIKTMRHSPEEGFAQLEKLGAIREVPVFEPG